MADPTNQRETKRTGPLRRVVGVIRGWLFSGGCRSCKSHEGDIDRWQRELAEQRGEAGSSSEAESKDARDG